MICETVRFQVGSYAGCQIDDVRNVRLIPLGIAGGQERVNTPYFCLCHVVRVGLYISRLSCGSDDTGTIETKVICSR